ncbi:hypothetical protein [Sphingorhabdus sp.]|uniref:hypothetical protein n=1 Tax=Sphingorhabdus sp. TaxID=1902408 RepID=UPI0038FC857F
MAIREDMPLLERREGVWDGTYTYFNAANEMIQLADSGVDRCRTWHWIWNGVLENRTAIQEKLVTRDWCSLEGQTG